MNIFEDLARISPAYLNDCCVSLDIDVFGLHFINSKYGRPYRYKNRKALTNYRSGNKKKLHQYMK